MNLQEQAVLARFGSGLPGENRLDKVLTSEVKTDKGLGHDAGRWTKQLYPKNALEKVKQIVGQAREEYYRLTLPWDDSGERILPTTTYLEFQAAMRGFRREFEAARDEFLAKFDDWVAWAKVEHNGSFNPLNYNLAKATKAFKWDVGLKPIPEGGDFRVSLQAADVEIMKRDLDERMQENLSQAQAELWERLATPVRKMVERLSDPDATFRDTLVTNLSDIVALVPKLNLTGDTKLEDFARECNDKLLQHSAETLRERPAARQATAKDADEILRRLEGLLPKREA